MDADETITDVLVNNMFESKKEFLGHSVKVQMMYSIGRYFWCNGQKILLLSGHYTLIEPYPKSVNLMTIEIENSMLRNNTFNDHNLRSLVNPRTS